MEKIETTNTANSRLGGLHHITAVTGNAAGNVAFYTQTLGMRLVKKAVNQDDVSAYHLFYGDGWPRGHRTHLLRLARRWPRPLRRGNHRGDHVRRANRAALTGGRSASASVA